MRVAWCSQGPEIVCMQLGFRRGERGVWAWSTVCWKPSHPGSSLKVHSYSKSLGGWLSRSHVWECQDMIYFSNATGKNIGRMYSSVYQSPNWAISACLWQNIFLMKNLYVKNKDLLWVNNWTPTPTTTEWTKITLNRHFIKSSYRCVVWYCSWGYLNRHLLTPNQELLTDQSKDIVKLQLINQRVYWGYF